MSAVSSVRAEPRASVAIKMLAVAAALGAVLVAPSVFYSIFLMKLLCFALFAAAYNLVFGYVGLLAFGHAAFFGASAYVTGFCALRLGLTPELSILAGMLVSTLLGVLFGWLAIRRQGLYFAMITLSLAQIVSFYAVQAPWTGGEDGLRPIPRGHLLGVIDLNNDWNCYLFVVAVFAAGSFLIWRTIHSPFGEVLKAIRDNEPRAISLGYDTNRYKLIAFTISAALSGLAGGTKAIVFQIATLVDLGFAVSGDVLLMVLIGGVGTTVGPSVGATVLVSLQNYLASLGSWVLLIQGIAFVVCILAFRGGIVGAIERLFQRIRLR